MVFFSRLPRSRLGSLAVAVLTCLLLVGMVASTCGGIRGCFSVDCVVRWFLPDSSDWVPVYLVASALAFGAIASVRFRLWQLPLPLLFFSSCACLVSSETLASWVLTVALAPDSERPFAFGRYLCSVSGSTPSSLVASWCGGLGAFLPFFPFPFGVVVTPGLRDRGLEGFFPSGWFLFQFWVALSPLWRWQAREAVSCGPCGVVVACLLHTQEVPGSIPGRGSYLRQVSLH